MTFAEAIAHLQSLGQFGFQPGLGTTLALAEAVGNPQLHLRFIHVAGTNGKGSTCQSLRNPLLFCRYVATVSAVISGVFEQVNINLMR
jgi:dihydrofolate synthase/folylpolyglutamate synthase